MYRLSAICHSALAGGRPRIPAASQAPLGDPKWRPGCARNRGGTSDPRAAGPRGGREAAPPAPIRVCGYKYVYVPGWLLPPASRRPCRSLAWEPRVGSAPSPGMCPPHPSPGLPPGRRGGHGHGHGRARSPYFVRCARFARAPRRQESWPLRLRLQRRGEKG